MRRLPVVCITLLNEKVAEMCTDVCDFCITFSSYICTQCGWELCADCKSRRLPAHREIDEETRSYRMWLDSWAAIRTHVPKGVQRPLVVNMNIGPSLDFQSKLSPHSLL